MTFGRSDSGWRGSRRKKARSLKSGLIQIVRTVPFRGVVAGLVIGWPHVRNSWAVAWTAPSRSLLGQIPALDGDPRNFEPPFAPRHRRQRSAPASCSRPRARSALIARSVPGGSSDSAGRNRSSVSRIYANSNFNRLRRKLVMEPMEWGQTLAIDQPFSDRAWAWQTKALPLSSLAAPSSALSWASSSPSPLPIYEPGAPITWR